MFFQSGEIARPSLPMVAVEDSPEKCSLEVPTKCFCKAVQSEGERRGWWMMEWTHGATPSSTTPFSLPILKGERMGWWKMGWPSRPPCPSFSSWQFGYCIERRIKRSFLRPPYSSMRATFFCGSVQLFLTLRFWNRLYHQKIHTYVPARGDILWGWPSVLLHKYRGITMRTLCAVHSRSH